MGSLRTKKGCLLGLSGTVLILSACFVYLSQSPEPYFARRHGELVGIDRQWQKTVAGSRLRGVELRSSSGLEVELTVRWPTSDSSTKLPLMVILGGHRTGQHAVELVANPGSVVLAALDYPYRGDHRLRGMAIVGALPQIRTALLDTPPAIWLALDYLLQLPFVDPSRVELVGVSLGAPLATVAGSLDSRFGRVWAIHGGGRPGQMIDTNLARELPGLLRVPAAALGGMLVAQIAPEKFAGRLAPRPFVMINAADDEKIPRVCVAALYASAGDPKELIWLPGGHLRPDAEQQLRQLVMLVLERIAAGPPAAPIR